MFKKTTYMWDAAAFNKLDEVFTAIINRFEEIEKRINTITDALEEVKKQPKVINNYYTQQVPVTYPVGPHTPYFWTTGEYSPPQGMQWSNTSKMETTNGS